MKAQTILTVSERQQALRWFILGILIQTIADHFEMSVESLKIQLNTENEYYDENPYLKKVQLVN